MKKIITKTVKGAVLAGVAAAAVSSAQAQYASLGSTYAAGDAVAGFTTGSGNELIVNLGLISSLSNGEQWNLSTLLGTGTGDAGFATDNSLQWGVLGIKGTTYYSTGLNNPTATGNAAAANYLKSMFLSNVNYPINSSGYVVGSASDTLSWNNNVATGNSGATESPYSLLLGSPDKTTAATGSFTFAQDAANWYTSGSTGAQQPLGFSFNSSGILMYGTQASAPEPGTYGLLAGVGMLLLAVRRQFARA